MLRESKVHNEEKEEVINMNVTQEAHSYWIRLCCKGK